MVAFRMTNVNDKEISWDVFGYYLPLQATFIEGDMMLDDRTWVEELNAKHQVSGTLYQISSTPDGKPMYFFFLGMSMMYSIFFFAGHFSAGLLGYPQNGLSEPYFYALIIGCLIYAIIGLYYLRKILLRFFPDYLVSILLLICVIGTNFINHMTLKNLETVNVLFMFVAIVIWNTIRWYEDYKLKNMLAIGVSIVLMALIKPSEVLIAMLPFLWGILSFEDVKQRISVLWKYKFQLVITVGVVMLIAAPQIMYWYAKTGEFFYDSYKNPGVGLDVTSPYLYESLIGFRKGWLIYTPVMILALLGFIVIFREQRKLFLGLFIPFVVAYYIIASWTEYWYGASFSNRPVISQYPILLIAMGFFFHWIAKKQVGVKIGVSLLVSFFIFLNLFQWWQYRNYILDATRMTKEYYWAIFMKTSVSEEDRKLLSLNRSYSPEGANALVNPQDYKTKILLSNFQMPKDSLEFMYTKEFPYKTLTKKDHCYVRFQMDYRVTGEKPTYLTVTIDRENGNYGAYYYDFKSSNEWQHLDTLYLTPEIRNNNDVLKFFIWNPNIQSFEAKNITVEILEKK